MPTPPSRAAVVSFEDEPLICVDTHDRVLGHESKAACHDGAGILHRAFSIFLFNGKGEVLMQQRSAEKRLWPLWWSNTCCSHPRRGEQVTAAASRRLAEEMALSAQLRFTHAFIYQAPFGNVGSEHELCSVFVGRADQEPEVHPREIAAVRWMTPEALDAALIDPLAPYTPWLRLEWKALREQHWAAVTAVVR